MPLDLSSVAGLLRSFTSRRHLNSGHQLHSLLLKSGHLPSLFASNILLQFYSRCAPTPGEARRLFDEMPERNPFSFNTLVDSYLNSNNTTASIVIFRDNPQKNSYSWDSIVRGLVRCGDLDNARRLFDEMPVVDSSSLNSLVHGYLRNGQALEAFLLYEKVNLDCKFVHATVVSRCADYRAYQLGKQIHARIVVRQVEMDSFLRSALVDMYGKCGDIDNAFRVLDLMENPDEFSLSALVVGCSNCGRFEDAWRVFNRSVKPSIVLWNSMIEGYTSNGQGEEAICLFIEMRRMEGVHADCSTFTSIFSACAGINMLQPAKMVHACSLKHGTMEVLVVASALVGSYSKCGSWEDACRIFNEIKVYDTVLLNSMITVYSNCGMICEARRLFDSISNKSLISWNSMVSGYSQNACAFEALDLFTEMHRLNIRLDGVALASAISATASICALELGEQLFCLAIIFGLESDPVISTSVIDLYCKCGNVTNGCRLFNWTTKSDIALWNSMMGGYASNGYGTEVLELFEGMRYAYMAPNEVTFVHVLSGCCHSGLVEEGLEMFYRMKGEYDIDQTVEHYSLVVNLLVRAGRLKEAMEFIGSMPFAADENMWMSVMGGCKDLGDEHIGGKVAESLLKLNPRQAGPFIQISGMYAAQGKWETSERIRQMMRERRIAKNPGYSWIDK